MKKDKRTTRHKLTSGLCALLITFFTGNSLSYAAPVSGDFASVPPTAVSSANTADPLVMLVMGNDHQLYYKAYDDWSDLDGDDLVDNTYKNSIDYYGYFDSYKCYDYSAINGRFEPQSVTTNKYCTGASNSYWSGNFLNWLSMSRMDIVRKTLYGGMRSTDTATDTVLERSHITPDGHSWVKFYYQSDLNSLTPFNTTIISVCNTTYDSGVALESQNSTAPPVMKVADGYYPYWDSNERWQCTWDDERGTNTGISSDPVKTSVGLNHSGGSPDYIVRVEACKSGLIGQESCKQYPNGNYKPIGLLQTHGENEDIKFGLLTGSYAKNKSGGVVRKDISVFTDELLKDGSGNIDTGQFDTSVNGIVSSLNKMRIARYEYGNNAGDGFYNNTDNCPWAQSSFTEGDCSNWGNPATEMYLEAVRYFAGLSRNTSFSSATTDDTAYIPGLTNVGTWTDPMSATNYCAACNIVMINTSDFSYDSDSLSMAGLQGTPNLNTYTDNVGVQEGLTSGSWFIGENGTDNNQLCTAKSITNLSDVRGSCPNSPRLGGSYQMAGIAHYSHTEDIRALQDVQSVNTYAVSMSPATPSLKIPKFDATGTKTGEFVNIIPACRNDRTTPAGNCAIVKFISFTPYAYDSATNTAYGNAVVSWEDTEQGGDYDMDMIGVITYTIGQNTIDVNTVVAGSSTPHQMGFGYIISGTTQDGFHVGQGINGFTYDDPDFPASEDCTAGCNLTGTYTTHSLVLGTSTAQNLKDPLWYAAKWGGFSDLNNNNEPDLQSEWDVVNNDTDVSVPDGIPDNYFAATSPKQLETKLDKVLTKISERFSSGTAAAVIANATAGTGLVTQALYQPRYSDAASATSITWGGILHSIFVDDLGNLREDTNQDGALGNYATDYVINFFYDTTLERARVARFTTPDGINLTNLDIVEVENLGTVWNTRNELAKLNDADIDTQRTYTDTITASDTRHILTWLDDDLDDAVDSTELVAFEDSTFTNSNFGALNIQADTDGDSDVDVNDARNVVNYIRGQENISGTNFRSRSIDYDSDGTNEVWRLGDIVNSSPVIVEAPTGSWDSNYGDDTYTDFRIQYAKRRQMIYVGANDGMLHAINGGFFDAGTRTYELTRTAVSPQETTDPASHPLGSEIWAYIPKNLLPHLQWLTEQGYPHVYYMDGRPASFDVNIFTPDNDHPGGWGTILVATMRLGGGSTDTVKDTTMAVDYDNADNDEDGTTGTDYTTRSAIVIMDVTNPEKPPVLLAEVTDANLGFTTSTPALVVGRKPDSLGDWSNPSVNDWYLTFGSGPTNLDTYTSHQNAYLYGIKLNDIDTDGTATMTKLDTAVASSFVGTPLSVEWTRDFLYDNVYFGLDSTDATSSPYATSGRLMRASLSTPDTDPDPDVDNSALEVPANWTLSTMINPSKPFNARPSTIKDNQGKWWVFAGTGRAYTVDDNVTTSVETFYGIKEDISSTGLPSATTFTHATTHTPGTTELQNVTDVVVYNSGAITYPAGQLPPSVTTVQQLDTHIQGGAGWYLNFDATTDNPHRRNFTNSTIFRQQILFTTYDPPADTCLPEGDSNLYSLYYKTGTGYPDIGLQTTAGDTTAVAVTNIDLGRGPAAEPVVYKGTGSETATVLTNLGTGVMTGNPLTLGGITSGRQSWREIFFE